MKSFNRTSLPSEIKYNGKTFVPDTTTSSLHMSGQRPDLTGKIMVKVLSRNLRGKIDLHNKPYKPTEHIYKVKD